MKKFLSALGLVCIFLFISGCDKEAEEDEQTEPPEIMVLLNQHPYADAIIKRISDFEKGTGIKVDFSVTPEAEYFDKVTNSFNRENSSPDVFMTGVYQTWDYAVAGDLEPLDDYQEDNIEDFFPNVLNAFRWDMIDGHDPGSGPLWAVPLGFEQYVLAYNKRIFNEENLQPPHTMEELFEICRVLSERRSDIYPLALRGSLNWATIHPAFMTTYANYGAKDYHIENGVMVSEINSKESKRMINDWIKLIRAGASPLWSSYSWYEASYDFGSGKAAMLFDADIVSYFQNPEGASKEAGNIGWVPAPVPESRAELPRVSNLWVWGLAMSKYSSEKTAAWQFINYFTSEEFLKWAAVNKKMVNPPRKSIFNDLEFRQVLSDADGYLDTFNKTLPGTRVLFTPHSTFFTVTTEWAGLIRDLVHKNEAEIDESLDAFKLHLDQIFSEARADSGKE